MKANIKVYTVQMRKPKSIRSPRRSLKFRFFMMFTPQNKNSIAAYAYYNILNIKNLIITINY